MDKQYCIGKLTVKMRKIKIVNMLTAHDDILEVIYLSLKNFLRNLL